MVPVTDDLDDLLDMNERLDDWMSTTSALGGTRDQHRGLVYARRSSLTRATLDNLYGQNALIARYVDLLYDDAFREGWEIEDLEGERVPEVVDVYKWAQELEVNKAGKQAGKWSRLYGGALAISAVRDQKFPNEPVEPARAHGSIYPFRAIDGGEARPGATDGGFVSPTYLQVLEYQIQGIIDGDIDVHHSRVFAFEPIKLPARAALSSINPIAQGWGPSSVERIYDELGRDGAAASHALSMMYVSSILYVKIEQLRQKFATRGGPEELQKWAVDFRKKLSSMGLALLDSKDEIGNLSLAVTGAHELIDRMRDRLASVSDLPKEIWFNESPAGLNAGELSGPQEIWFAKVSAWQNDVGTAYLTWALNLIFAAKGYAVDSFTIKWLPLWSKSDEKQAATAASNATADAVYMDHGAVTPEEVREHRFVRGSLSPIMIEADAPAAPLDLSGALAPDEVAAVAEPTDKVADAAMNGAQVASMLEIVQSVVAGLLPRDSAIAILQAAFPSQAHRAEAIIGSAGAVTMEQQAADETAAAEAPSDDPPPADLASPRDAGAALAVPTRTITLAIERGDLRYWGLGAHKRVSLADVARLAKAHENEPEPEVA